MPHAQIHAPSFVPAATALNRTAKPTEGDKIHEQAQKWVAQTFFGTLLKQVRNSPFRSELFEGGRGGEAFGSLYDQQMAEHMARGAGAKLVNAIASRIQANAAYRRSGKARHTPTPQPDARKLPIKWSTHGSTSFRA